MTEETRTASGGGAQRFDITWFSGTGGVDYCAERLRSLLTSRGAICHMHPLDRRETGNNVVGHPAPGETAPAAATPAADTDTAPSAPAAGESAGPAAPARPVQSVSSPARLVLIYPVYAGDAPIPVKEWLAGLPAGRASESRRRRDTDSRSGTPWKDAAVLSVSGGGEVFPNNDCRRRTIRSLARLGVPTVYEEMLVMPSNWTILTPPALNDLLYKATEHRLERITGHLCAGELRRSPPAVGSMLFSWMAALEKRGSARFGRNIRAGEACNGCGWCARNCPRGNITMTDAPVPVRRPVFDSRCVICMRCLYGCPQNALRPQFLKFFRIDGFRMTPDSGDEAAVSAPVDGPDLRRLIIGNTRKLIWLGLRRYLIGELL